MAFDLIRSHFGLIMEKEVEAGATFAEEGLCVVRELVSGAEKAKPSDGSSGDADHGFMGFVIKDEEDHLTLPVVEGLTVGTTGTYSTLTLDNNNLVAASVSGIDDTTTTALTVITEPTDPAADEVSIDFAAGTARFLVAGNGGDAVRLFYRYNLTVEEAQRTFHQRTVNNTASVFFEQISVGGGNGAIYTTEYDTNDDWTTGGDVYTGAAGRLTKATTSTVIVGQVIKLPSADDPFLGVAFDSNLG